MTDQIESKPSPMFKYAGYVLRSPDTLQYAEVFLPTKQQAEKFCLSRGISLDYIKQVYIHE